MTSTGLTQRFVRPKAGWFNVAVVAQMSSGTILRPSCLVRLYMVLFNKSLILTKFFYFHFTQVCEMKTRSFLLTPFMMSQVLIHSHLLAAVLEPTIRSFNSYFPIQKLFRCSQPTSHQRSQLQSHKMPRKHFTAFATSQSQ